MLVDMFFEAIDSGWNLLLAIIKPVFYAGLLVATILSIGVLIPWGRIVMCLICF